VPNMNKTLPQKTSNTRIAKENYLKLLSIIAHNVKGPVRYMEFITDYTIRNWEQMQPADLLDCAKVINETAHNISEELGNMLSWARLQDGTFNPNLQSLLLKDVLADELRLQGTIVKMKEIELAVEIDENLSVFSDSNLLKLAFHNILSNAIKFTKRGDQITIAGFVKKNEAILRVKDSGVGMTAQDLDLVCNNKSFSNPGTVNEQGTGFGLHISREIIELLNGTLTVESEIGVGTTVTIALPH